MIDAEYYLGNLSQESLNRLYNINSNQIKKLKAHGVTTLSQLRECKNLEHLAQKSNFHLVTLKKYQLNAKSIKKGKIYQIAPFGRFPREKIYFDLETDLNSNKIWFIGFEIDGHYNSLYAETWEQERDILREFTEVLKNNPKSSLITYSGTNFDFRVMENALKRHSLDTNEFLSHDQIDLCTLIKRSFITPQGYRLKPLGRHFNYPFKHSHLRGSNVASYYITHIKTGEPLNKEILEYAEDDVKVLPFILEKLEKGEGIIQNILPNLPTQYSPKKLSETSNDLKVKIKEFYEEHGNLSIKRDKRDNSIKAEMRFKAKKLDDLDFIRNAMKTLSFREGSPYIYASGTRCYDPYNDKSQIIRFMK